MTGLRVLLARLRGLFLSGRLERELADEIESHVVLSVDENVRRGMDPDEARRAALRAFGGVEQAKEVYRDRRGLPAIETLLQDLRYVLRILGRSPGFAAAAALSIAIGIGANATIFSLINAVLLRTLPVKQPEQLVLFSIGGPRGNDYSFSYPHYEQLRDGVTALSSLIASGGTNRMRMVVSASQGAGTPESVQAEKVSGNFFSALGVEAELGRTLTNADDTDGAPPVAVISHGLWQRRFGGDPEVADKSITLDDVPFTIVGVAPRRFFGFEVGANPEVWWPLHQLPRVSRGSVLASPGWTWLRLLGRLAPGATMAQTHAQSSAIFERMLAESAERNASAKGGAAWTPTERRQILEQRLVLESGSTGWARLRGPFRAPLFVLMAIVGLVLLISCANVANLLLARASARQKEISMRLAIGASRLRIVRQLLTESVLLALIGGGMGVFGALGATRFLSAYLSDFIRTVFPQRAMSLDLTPDARVLAFTLSVSVATGILFGLAPALRATRFDLTSALKQAAGPAARGRSGSLLQRALVVSQVALSLFLLVGTGLLVRSLQNLRNLDTGYDSEQVLLFSMDAGTGYDAAARTRLYQEVMERLGALPGARSASVSTYGLMSSNNWGNKVLVEGYAARPDEDLRCLGQSVGPRFFETFGIPLRRGREFGPQDTSTAPQVAVINETMSRYFFGQEDPIGRRFILPARPEAPIQIVGVARDVKYRNLRERPARAFYVPFLQHPSSAGPVVALRTAGSPVSVVPAVRRALTGIDSQLQVLDVRTMADVIDASLVQERLVSQLASFFSAAALVLAALGLYGVMSYGVARKTAEIGLRMALGARRPDVLWLVLREALALAVVGAAIGLPAGLLGSRAISSLLFGLSPSDPVTLTLAAALLFAVAALAGYLPARRAARVDPLIALRCE